MCDGIRRTGGDMKPSFVSLDFELANSSHASICSVGIVRVTNGIVMSKKFWHLRPPAPHDKISDYNRQHFAVNEECVANAGDFAQFAPALVAGIQGGIVVGQGIRSADLSMFTQAWFAAGLPLPSPDFRFVCTHELGRARMPGLSSYRLPDLHLAATGLVMTGHHTPDEDALASANIVLKLVPTHADLESLARFRSGKFSQVVKPSTGRQIPPRQIR